MAWGRTGNKPLSKQCMKWPVAHSPNSTWFWLELVGNCCERLKIIMKYTNIQFCERLGHGWQFRPLSKPMMTQFSYTYTHTGGVNGWLHHTYKSIIYIYMPHQLCQHSESSFGVNMFANKLLLFWTQFACITQCSHSKNSLLKTSRTDYPLLP